MNTSEPFFRLRPITILTVLVLFVFSAPAFAQDRDRIVEKTNKTDTKTESGTPQPAKRPQGLTNDVVVVREQEPPKPLIRRPALPR